jgi:hypothetical protein
MKQAKLLTIAIIVLLLKENSYSQLYNRSKHYYGFGINYISTNPNTLLNPQFGISFTKSVIKGNNVNALISYQKNKYYKNRESIEKPNNITLGVGWAIDLKNIHIISYENKHNQCVSLTIKPFTGIYYNQEIISRYSYININSGIKLFVRKSGMGKKDNMFEKSISISTLIERQNNKIQFGFKISIDLYKYKVIKWA